MIQVDNRIDFGSNLMFIHLSLSRKDLYQFLDKHANILTSLKTVSCKKKLKKNNTAINVTLYSYLL